MRKRVKPLAIWAELPVSATSGPAQLSIAWEDTDGNWHFHGYLFQATYPDLEAMGVQVMRAWISQARKAMDGP